MGWKVTSSKDGTLSLTDSSGEFGEVLVLFCLIPIIGDFLILMLAASRQAP